MGVQSPSTLPTLCTAVIQVPYEDSNYEFSLAWRIIIN